jgi:hypothetical protein
VACLSIVLDFQVERGRRKSSLVADVFIDWVSSNRAHTVVEKRQAVPMCASVSGAERSC